MQNTLLYGIGRTNKSLLQALLKDQKALKITSDNPSDRHSVPEAIWIDPEEAKTRNWDLIYATPGISRKHWVHQNNCIKNEIEFGLPFFKKARIIGVTGSNGKSSTCKLIHDYLNHLGYRAILAGNYGIPLCDSLDKAESTDFIVLELSSFQLHSIRHTPFLDVALFTSFEPNHLDWHASLEEYKMDKLRIFDLLKPGCMGFLDQELTLKKDGVYTSSTDQKADLCLQNGQLACLNQTLPWMPEKMLSKTAWLNWFGAMVGLGLGSQVAESIKNFAFQPLPHRLEIVGHKENILFVNDSKSTTPGATLYAIDQIQTSSLSLILGGKSKSLDLEPFFQELKKRQSKIHRLFVYGDLCSSESLLSALGFRVYANKSWEGIRQEILKFHDLGQAVLLSPAFSSLDQFSSFEERGKSFREFIQKT